jgi:alpha-mannosidase
VFVVPHSHSDPGWLKTFEGYFHSQTKHTLDLAVDKLMLYPNMTFVWNEISFLSLWWEGARSEQKSQMRQLIREGRLEILTGGWVMPDEATVNLYSLVDELIEGRQWVVNRLGIVPTVSWSIDPFGHGAAMPYLLKSAGIDNMVIQVDRLITISSFQGV